MYSLRMQSRMGFLLSAGSARVLVGVPLSFPVVQRTKLVTLASRGRVFRVSACLSLHVRTEFSPPQTVLQPGLVRISVYVLLTDDHQN